MAALLPAAVLVAWARIPGTPWWLVAIGIVLWTLTAIGRREPLLIAAAFLPLVSVLGGWQQWTVPAIEPFVLTIVGGWLTRLALGGERIALTPRIREPWILMILVIAASLVVEIAVLQLFVPEPAELVDRVFSGSAYLLDRGAFPPLPAAALLLEGLALFAIVAGSIDDEEGRRQLLLMSLAGAAAAAALNVNRLLTIALRAPDVRSMLEALTARVRINVHHVDVNAAGSYFALMTTTAVRLASSERRFAVGLWIAAALGGAALWLTGSRVALVFAALAIFGFIVSAGLSRVSGRQRWVLVGGVAAIAVVLAATAWTRFGGFPAFEAARVRLELTRTALRMGASHPLFGVGIGRFYQQSTAFASPALLREYARENAHNYFLQVWAELGTAGLAAFVWLIAAALTAGAARSPAVTAIRWGAGVFLATCLTGHPLLIADVAYPFWMLLGLSAAPVHDAAIAMGSAANRTRVIRYAAIAVLLVSIVPRAIQQRRQADLEETAFGVTSWYRDGSGAWVRDLHPHATFFLPSGRLAIIPLRLGGPSDRGTKVQLVLDGRLANEVIVRGEEWQPIRIELPPLKDGHRFHRIELHVLPASGQPPPHPVVMGRVMSLS